MIMAGRRLLSVGAAIAIVAALGGCSRVRDHQGYIADKALVASVQPGVDNRESVERTLGRPSFVSAFDPSSWYYLSRDTRQFAFGTPKPAAQTVIAVKFDAAGNVAAVERKGMEQIASIRPAGDKTPTLGRNKSLLSEIFGNIGRVGGSGQSAPTADNPN